MERGRRLGRACPCPWPRPRDMTATLFFLLLCLTPANSPTCHSPLQNQLKARPARQARQPPLPLDPTPHAKPHWQARPALRASKSPRTVPVDPPAPCPNPNLYGPTLVRWERALARRPNPRAQPAPGWMPVCAGWSKRTLRGSVRPWTHRAGPATSSRPGTRTVKNRAGTRKISSRHPRPCPGR